MRNTKKIFFLCCCLFLVLSGLEAQVKFIWPLKQATGFNDPSYYSIGNYVDHNPRQGVVRDYNGGYRTYDGHKGLDIGLYPDRWRKKWVGQVDVIAAAAGVIDTIVDGHNDNNCSWQGQPANYVKLKHVDGTVTCYKHLKKFSVISKQKGDPVAEGEYLGKVASSGNSTGPHLHFEVRDAQGNVIDPFVGPNNPTTNISRWKNQKAYYDGGINKVYIGSDFVSSLNGNCFQFMNLHAKNEFLPGQRVYVSSFIRTPAPNSLINIYIFKPDGTLHNNNTFFYQFPLEAAIDKGKKRTARLYRSFNLPFSALAGTWTVIVTYNSLLSNSDIVTFKVKSNDLSLNIKPIEGNGLGINTTRPLETDAQIGILQRSYDGETWQTIVDDIDPSSLLEWEYEDLNADLTETVYYRINSLDVDGKESTGDVFYWKEDIDQSSTDRTEMASLVVDIFPNPTSSALYLATEETDSNKEVEITTLSGQVLGAFKWEKGAEKLPLQVGYLPAGVYSIKVTQGDQSTVQPFVKY